MLKDIVTLFPKVFYKVTPSATGNTLQLKQNGLYTKKATVNTKPTILIKKNKIRGRKSQKATIYGKNGDLLVLLNVLTPLFNALIA